MFYCLKTCLTTKLKSNHNEKGPYQNQKRQTNDRRLQERDTGLLFDGSTMNQNRKQNERDDD